jgi:ATPase subunit of ABC transporter with duplicated ATPase domains
MMSKFKGPEDVNYKAVLQQIEGFRSGALQLIQDRYRGWHTEQAAQKAKLIVDSLKDAQLTDRRAQVTEAHKHTFTLILEPRPMFTNFPTWLREGRGVFWIYGKAGSGKSTLMKRIIYDKRTKQRFRHWSCNGTRDPVMIQHFFWLPGTHLQKSHWGMLQSLLHQILSADERIVASACPRR